ncbi:hypothetical protein EHW67_07645 [Arenibacter aquaticus]|uniref:O-antigen ligase-related domain-containing protein n=1 Tax=Arenibacter aquaticus TaxID=2489054 RepID=A0A430K3Z9_9FLAO|nr:O-antigen ligase family protein [Arenibacter aquaticus]RTE53800.1 hypothetical protein EHW67_07645 [Arenibacter aquaticus]
MIEIIKWFCLGLIVLNAPTFGLHAFGSAAGSILSALTFGMPLVYAILVKNVHILKIYLAIGLGYFLISGIQFYNGVESDYFSKFYKFLILVILGGAIAKNTSKKELFWLLIIGSSSVIANAIFFTDTYGRYSGFYLDPNAAGFICITGYGLSYGMEKGKLKLLGQFIFTFAGFLTFSRTFILLWILLNLIALKINPKNIRIFAIGAVVIILLISFSEALKLNVVRFNQLKALVSNEKVSTQELNEDSRTATWATFYDYVLDKPLLGNGYGSFQTNGLNRVGPHNSFLLVIGEAGVFILLIFLGYHIYLLYQGAYLFTSSPHIVMMTIGLFLFLLTNHNYFTAYYLILLSMWILTQIKQPLDEN